MAVTKLGNSKNGGRSMDYAEKKAEVKNGVNCDIELAKEQFKATREIWGKNNGVQVHTIIQSFKPGEVTSEQANLIGVKLAEKIAGRQGFEVAVYTHSDQRHLHNHIVINAVNAETGLKYHSNKSQLREVKKVNDELCKTYGLSIANEQPAKMRYTQAEQAILSKGKDSWKDEIRQAIDHLLADGESYEKFKHDLRANFGIVVDDRRKHVAFIHPDNEMRCRGLKLGERYTREEICNVIEIKVREREQNYTAEKSISGDRKQQANVVREHNPQNRLSGGEQGKSRSDTAVKGIREKIAYSTPAGRRKADEEQRAIEEANRRALEERKALERQLEQQRAEFIQREQQIHIEPKSIGLSR